MYLRQGRSASLRMRRQALAKKLSSYCFPQERSQTGIVRHRSSEPPLEFTRMGQHSTLCGGPVLDDDHSWEHRHQRRHFFSIVTNKNFLHGSRQDEPRLSHRPSFFSKDTFRHQSSYNSIPQSTRRFHSTPRQDILPLVLGVGVAVGGWMAYRAMNGKSLQSDQSLELQNKYKEQQEALRNKNNSSKYGPTAVAREKKVKGQSQSSPSSPPDDTSHDSPKS